MAKSAIVIRRIVLNARSRSAPTAADFRIESDRVPQPEAGQALLRTPYLSRHPWMRDLIDELGFDLCVDHRADDLPGHPVARMVVGNHRGATSADGSIRGCRQALVHHT